MSFATRPAAPSAAELLSVATAALRPSEAHALADAPVLVDQYERPADGRRACTYRFVYSSARLALHRERALGLNARVCEALEAELGAEHRNPVAQAAAAAAEAAEAADE